MTNSDMSTLECYGDRMSLRHAALGLLAKEPASGYDLLKKFKSTMHPVWPATQSQLYGELNKLAAAGFTTVSEAGARGRKEYAITDAGRAELAARAPELDALESEIRDSVAQLSEPEEHVAHRLAPLGRQRSAQAVGGVSERCADAAALSVALDRQGASVAQLPRGAERVREER